ncbi:cation diffusion facilitator family transporter [Mumia quercus]|uniref:cation diffusion facilitator family transporter n=1 Tax=Mumia quercus TaxID=2976125 RepID=UPI0021CED684|nr:cation diffusion facilitator family transporter [Mumia quercus]
MGHDHAHATPSARQRPRLAFVLGLTVLVLLVEVVVALLAGSLALLADAGHMLSDSFGLVMALVAVTVAQRPGSPRRTFGNHRTEILAAGANGVILLGLCVGIVVSAVRRLGEAPHVDSPLMLAAGVLGFCANVVGLVVLRAGAKESLNVKGAYLEVLGDAFGSVAVIVAGVVIATTGWYAADPVASLVIAALILPRALGLLREVVDVLLESTPRGLDLEELRSHMAEVPGVVDVHDLHVWTITSGMPVMSAHVVVDDEVLGTDAGHGVLDRLRCCLSDHFDVEHSTFQLEPASHAETEQHTHR